MLAFRPIEPKAVEGLPQLAAPAVEWPMLWRLKDELSNEPHQGVRKNPSKSRCRNPNKTRHFGCMISRAKNRLIIHTTYHSALPIGRASHASSSCLSPRFHHQSEHSQ